jgi:hypothetical protein
VRVATKTTDFLDDQVLVRAFARGGLSEVPEKQYLDALYAGTIAGELGMFGLRPETLFDALAGKRADVAAKTGTYFRRVDGDTSPTDIEDGSAAHVHALHSRCAFDARAGGAGSRTKNAGTSHSQSQPRPGERV